MIDETLTYGGRLYALVSGTYDMEICDICGRRRKCDYWQSYGESDKRFWDICRSCLSRIKAGETEESMTGGRGD